MSAPTIRQELEQLRTELAALRLEIATEVRTRRLVVVDEHGAPAITSRVEELYAGIEVEWCNTEGYSAVAQMYASNSSGGEAGFAVIAADEVVAHLIGEIDSHGEDNGRETLCTTHGTLYVAQRGWAGRSAEPDSSIDIDSRFGVDGLTTRRVAVVDEAGKERIYTTVNGSASVLQVATADGMTAVCVSADHDSSMEGPTTDVALINAGEVIACLSGLSEVDGDNGVAHGQLKLSERAWHGDTMCQHRAVDSVLDHAGLVES